MRRAASAPRGLRLEVVVLLALAAWAGCTDDVGDARPRPADAGVSEAGVTADPCLRRDDGERCGSGMHCFSQECVEDACGDGMLSPGEACDDGNQRWGDGCDSTCVSERSGCPNGELDGDEECDDGNWFDDDGCSNLCIVTSGQCGNKRVDPGEECDDGNVIDEGDDCPNTCLYAECRNGRLEAAEECDDGNTVDKGDGCTNECKLTICGNGVVEKYETCDDGNSADGDACPHDCYLQICGNGRLEGAEVCEGPAIVKSTSGTYKRRGCSHDCLKWLDGDDDPCNACERDQCRTSVFAGLDVFKGCFEEVNAEFGATVPDPDFLDQCAEVVQCALEHGCGFTEQYQAAECYCGANSGDACTTEGPDRDAPCLLAWFDAARTTDNAGVQVRFSDFAYPAGWAYFAVECYGRTCGDVCRGRAPARRADMAR